MDPLLEFDYRGLTKIISGGQMGADIGALFAAKRYGVTTGGSAPNGWATCAGPLPSLESEFGLTESTGGYRKRTIENVIAADATLIIATDVDSVGTRLTIRSCVKHKKPFLVHFNRQQTFEWVIANRVSILNCAGNRDIAGTKHFDLSFRIVENLIIDLKQAGRLVLKE